MSDLFHWYCMVEAPELSGGRISDLLVLRNGLAAILCPISGLRVVGWLYFSVLWVEGATHRPDGRDRSVIRSILPCAIESVEILLEESVKLRLIFPSSGVFPWLSESPTRLVGRCTTGICRGRPHPTFDVLFVFGVLLVDKVTIESSVGATVFPVAAVDGAGGLTFGLLS